MNAETAKQTTDLKDRPIPWVKVVDQDNKWCILDAEPLSTGGTVTPRIVAKCLTKEVADQIIEAVNAHWENTTNLEMADEYIEELKRERDKFMVENQCLRHALIRIDRDVTQCIKTEKGASGILLAPSVASAKEFARRFDCTIRGLERGNVLKIPKPERTCKFLDRIYHEYCTSRDFVGPIVETPEGDFTTLCKGKCENYEKREDSQL